MTRIELLKKLAQIVSESETEDSIRISAHFHADSETLIVQVAPPDKSNRWFSFTLDATQSYP